MAERRKAKDIETENKTTVTMRMDSHLFRYFNEVCERAEKLTGKRTNRTKMMENHLRMGAYYFRDLYRPVLSYLRLKAKDEYGTRKEELDSSVHNSFVDGERLDIEEVIASRWIREAIEEKIARENPDFLDWYLECRDKSWKNSASIDYDGE